MTGANGGWVRLIEVDGDAAERFGPADAPDRGSSAGVVTRAIRTLRHWWRAAERSTRIVAVLAALAAITAFGAAASAGLARHPVAAVVRTVPAPAPVAVDASGCPLTTTCAVRDAGAAARAVRFTVVRTPAAPTTGDPFTARFANLPFLYADAVDVYDVSRPAIVYARSLYAVGTFDGADLVLRITAHCARPLVGSTTAKATAALGAPVAVDTYVGEYGGCSISVLCSYQGLFTAGGYPYDSPQIAALVAGLANNPRIRL